MSSSSPTDGWELVENHFYRKIQSYTELWEEDEIDLDDYMVAAAPYGGALGMWLIDWVVIGLGLDSNTKIALYRTDTKPKAYRGTQQKPSIDLYTCSGKLIRKLPVRSHPSPSPNPTFSSLQSSPTRPDVGFWGLGLISDV